MEVDVPGGCPASSEEPGGIKNTHGSRPVNNNIARTKNLYNAKSKGPFNIFIQLKDEAEVTYISPLLIGRDLTRANVQGIKNIKKLNKKRVLVEFSSALTANHMINNYEKFLKDSYAAFIPSHLIECKGVIRVDRDMTVEEVTINIEVENYKINKIRRIQKKTIDKGIEKKNRHKLYGNCF